MTAEAEVSITRTLGCRLPVNSNLYRLPDVVTTSVDRHMAPAIKRHSCAPPEFCGRNRSKSPAVDFCDHRTRAVQIDRKHVQHVITGGFVTGKSGEVKLILEHKQVDILIGPCHRVY